MATLSIQSNINLATLEAFKNLFLSIDPNAKVDICAGELDLEDEKIEHYDISEADKKRFLETLELYKQGKLEFLSFEESLERSNDMLRKLGAKI